MKISVITPSFDREAVLVSSVISSIEFMESLPIESRGEIVVVDDSSSVPVRKTLDEAGLGLQIGNLICLIVLEKNIGVTGAKQVGANRASGDWLIFLDSDDAFISGVGRPLLAELTGARPNIPIVFFRCRGMQSKTLIGERKPSTEEIGLKEFLVHGTPGECLPAVRRRAILEYPYDENLRGFEGLTHAKIVREYGQCLVSKLEARWYDESDDSRRLSSAAGLTRRGCSLARGHALTIFTFYRELQVRIMFLIALKVIRHSLSCFRVKLSGVFS